MPVFKTDIKTFANNELKSWAWAVSLSAVASLFCYYVIGKSKNDCLFYFGLFIFMKLSDFFTKSYVNAIQVEKEKGKLNIRLKCLMTGYDYKSYVLKEVRSEIKERKSWISFNKPYLELKIYLPKNRAFVITNRYGFTEDSLQLINVLLNSEN
jgi:hypothetical protein